jgi:hypothetical protein
MLLTGYLRRLAAVVPALFLVFLVFAVSAGAANASVTTYLRPNADRTTTSPWTVVGATHAWEALRDKVVESQTPDLKEAKYISATVKALSSKTFSTEVDLETTSLTESTLVDARVGVYTQTSTPVTVEVVSGSAVLGSAEYTSVGWHSLPIALDGTQTQLDNLTLRFTTGGRPLEPTGAREVRAAFVRVSLEPSAAVTTSRLRPDGTIATENPWTVSGAASAWEALDDNVTEQQTATNADYITANSVITEQLGPNTVVSLGNTSLIGKTVLDASAWFYSSESSAVTLEVLSGATVVAKQKFSGTGWHALSVPRGTVQSEVNNLSLRFRLGSGFSGTRKVPVAFLRLVVKEPPSQIFWGAWMDGHVYVKQAEEEAVEKGIKYKEWGDAPWESRTWEAFSSHAGKHASVIHFGQPAPWGQKFAKEPLEDSTKEGAYPMMDMGTKTPREGKTVTLAEIAEGKLDGPYKEWFEEVAKYGKPFFFRWDWEMNLIPSESINENFPWVGQAAAHPEDFVLAWQHLHDLAEEAKASNVTWVWCPNVSYSSEGVKSTSLEALYPGDSYVDWLCMDGYNKATGSSGWRSFSSIFSTTYNELLAIAPTRPIMIGETASTELGGSKAEWITDTLKTSLPENFPSIRALVWFNWNITEEGREWEWPIESSASSQSAFASGIASSYYAANSFSEPTPLAPILPLP